MPRKLGKGRLGAPLEHAGISSLAELARRTLDTSPDLGVKPRQLELQLSRFHKHGETAFFRNRQGVAEAVGRALGDATVAPLLRGERESEPLAPDFDARHGILASTVRDDPQSILQRMHFGDDAWVLWRELNGDAHANTVEASFVAAVDELGLPGIRAAWRNPTDTGFVVWLGRWLGRRLDSTTPQGRLLLGSPEILTEAIAAAVPNAFQWPPTLSRSAWESFLPSNFRSPPNPPDFERSLEEFSRARGRSKTEKKEHLVRNTFGDAASIVQALVEKGIAVESEAGLQLVPAWLATVLARRAVTLTMYASAPKVDLLSHAAMVPAMQQKVLDPVVRQLPWPRLEVLARLALKQDDTGGFPAVALADATLVGIGLAVAAGTRVPQASMRVVHDLVTRVARNTFFDPPLPISRTHNPTAAVEALWTLSLHVPVPRGFTSPAPGLLPGWDVNPAVRDCERYVRFLHDDVSFQVVCDVARRCVPQDDTVTEWGRGALYLGAIATRERPPRGSISDRLGPLLWNSRTSDYLPHEQQGRLAAQFLWDAARERSGSDGLGLRLGLGGALKQASTFDGALQWLLDRISADALARIARTFGFGSNAPMWLIEKALFPGRFSDQSFAIQPSVLQALVNALLAEPKRLEKLDKHVNIADPDMLPEARKKNNAMARNARLMHEIQSAIRNVNSAIDTLLIGNVEAPAPQHRDTIRDILLHAPKANWPHAKALWQVSPELALEEFDRALTEKSDLAKAIAEASNQHIGEIVSRLERETTLPSWAMTLLAHVAANGGEHALRAWSLRARYAASRA